MYIGRACVPVWGLGAAGGTAGAARLGCRMGTPWRGSGGHQARRVQGQPLHHPSSVLRQPGREPAAPVRDTGGVWAAPPGGEVIVP